MLFNLGVIFLGASLIWKLYWLTIATLSDDQGRIRTPGFAYGWVSWVLLGSAGTLMYIGS